MDNTSRCKSSLPPQSRLLQANRVDLPSLPYLRPISACRLATPSTILASSPPLKTSVPCAGSPRTPVRLKGWRWLSSLSTEGRECASESSKRIFSFSIAHVIKVAVSTHRNSPLSFSLSYTHTQTIFPISSEIKSVP